MTGEDQPRHRRARVVRPAERPPDLELRSILRLEVGHVGAAIGMEPDRQVVRRHRLEERQELGRRNRLAGDVREDLESARVQLVDGAMQFAERRIRIGERQRRDERGEAIGILPHQLRHAIVGRLRQINRVRGACEDFDRRRRQR